MPTSKSTKRTLSLKEIKLILSLIDYKRYGGALQNVYLQAEHRTLLRQDNADLRLTPVSFDLGLAKKERLEAVEKKLPKPLNWFIFSKPKAIYRTK